MANFSVRNPQAERRISRIELQRILPSPHQPRTDFDGAGIVSLAESIRRCGLLSPLLVRRAGCGQYELIAGERRLRAMQLLGWISTEAIVLGVDDRDSALIALIENLQRENLHYLDEAAACRWMLSEHGMTQEALAGVMGKSPSALANLLRLLRLDEEVRRRLRESGLSERHGRALLKLREGQQQLKLLEEAAQEGLSVRQLEERIARLGRSRPAARLPEGILKENRLVINAVKDTVRQLRRIGVEASSRVEARADAFDVIVTVQLRRE